MLKKLITILLSIFIISGCDGINNNYYYGDITDSGEIHELVGICIGSYELDWTGTDCVVDSSFDSTDYRIYFEDGTYDGNGILYGNWTVVDNLIFTNYTYSGNSYEKNWRYIIINNELHISEYFDTDFSCNYQVWLRE